MNTPKGQFVGETVVSFIKDEYSCKFTFASGRELKIKLSDLNDGSEEQVLVYETKEKDPIEYIRETFKTTHKEAQVLKYIANVMNGYGEGFSDVMVEDLVAGLEEPVNTIKGLIGSLTAKGLIFGMDVNGEYDVYYISKNVADKLLDHEVDY